MMIPSQEVLRQLLDYDPETGALTWRRRPTHVFTRGKRQKASANAWNRRFAGQPAFQTDHGNGYRSGSIWKRRCFAHRVVWMWMIGDEPECIDHINGDRSDNRWGNLRAVGRAENSRNSAMPYTNTSGHIGVSFQKSSGKWETYIGDGNTCKRLGRFKCLTAAVVARKSAEVRLGYHANHGR